ncbi:hypothetical protein [Desulfosporosinus burensis]
MERISSLERTMGSFLGRLGRTITSSDQLFASMWMEHRVEKYLRERMTLSQY